MNEQNIVQKLQSIQQNITNAQNQLQKATDPASHQVTNNLNTASTTVQELIQTLQSGQTQGAGGSRG